MWAGISRTRIDASVWSRKSDPQDERRQAQLLGQCMFAESTVKLPVNEFPVNVDVQEEAKNNNNDGEMDFVIDNSAPQSNIFRCSSPDLYVKYFLLQNITSSYIIY